jgi:hypothetical protein
LATLVEIGVEEHLMVREAGVPVLVMSDVLGPGVLARRFRRRITGRDRFGATEIRIGIQRTRPPEYHSCLEDLSPWEVGIKGIINVLNVGGRRQAGLWFGSRRGDRYPL